MGFARKLKRRQFLSAKKNFMKEFKRQMKHFKKQVKCARCDYHPNEGENIDNWRIDKDSNGIDLVCETCMELEEEEDEFQTNT